ncbi:MAG TPA: hypothetical protein VHV83_18075, partial [Armatimonadota bacterium]|nr:hypothetical protein [Armatimonadota bacterium]
MQSDDNVLTFTPEPISELIDTLPAKGILILIKNQPILSRRIFLGFSAREKSLALPVVRQRLETELHKQPEFSESLLKLWQQIYADLIKVIISDTFQPTPEILTSLVHDYGKPAVHFALSHAQSEDLRQYADQLPEIEPETKVHDVSPPSPEYTKKDQRIAETSQQLQDITQERDTLKHEVAQLKKQLVELSTQLKDTLESKSEIEKRLTREQRRSTKIEEEYERLRKDINQQAKRLNEETEAPHIPDEIVLSVTEAVSLLQNSLAVMTGSQPNEAVPLATSVPT